MQSFTWGKGDESKMKPFARGAPQLHHGRVDRPPVVPLQAEVRQLAAAAALPNQARRDSQGICFLGRVRFSEFVREHLGTWHGVFLEQETGELVGYHEGFWFYTLGQRKGIPLSGGPW